ncbi:MAG: hypothetical protein MUF00_03115 [Gemmatimonadaceae bacterium]|jgi:hypothetical protein|nr:hypothetical protein [Gemmatimonadaceae bacterium]
MTDDQLAEDLAFVRRALEASQKAADVDLVPLLIWGTLTAVAAAASYVVPALDSVWFWVAVIGSAWVLTAVRLRSRGGLRPPQIIAQRAFLGLWSAMLGAMTLIGFGGVFAGVVQPQAITPIFAGLFGAGFIAASALVQRPVVAWLGGLWWVTALALFVMSSSLRLGAFALAIVCWLIVPIVRVVARRPVA